MRNLRNQDDYWKPCRPGTLFGASHHQNREQRRKFAVQIAMGAVVAIAAVFSTWFILSRKKNRELELLADNEGVSETKKLNLAATELTCRQVVDRIPEYVKAVRKESEERNVDEMQIVVDFDQHLQVCESCRPKVLAAINQA